MRRRGRPRQDERDQLTVDLAAALRIKLGPQQSRDLALALLEGMEITLSRRGDLRMVSFRLPATVKGRSDALKRRGPRSRDIAVRAIVRVLLR